MNTFFTKIASIFLALLVLFSTFSFTVIKHYCGEALVGISFFGSAENCSDEEGEEDCDDPKVLEEEKCCTDELQPIDGQDDLRTTVEKLDIKKEQFFVAFCESYRSLFTESTEKKNWYSYYLQPTLIKDFQALHQVYIL